MFKPKEIKIRLSKRELKEALKKASSRKGVKSKYRVIWDELEDTITRQKHSSEI